MKRVYLTIAAMAALVMLSLAGLHMNAHAGGIPNYVRRAPPPSKQRFHGTRPTGPCAPNFRRQGVSGSNYECVQIFVDSCSPGTRSTGPSLKRRYGGWIVAYRCGPIIN